MTSRGSGDADRVLLGCSLAAFGAVIAMPVALVIIVVIVAIFSERL